MITEIAIQLSGALTRIGGIGAVEISERIMKYEPSKGDPIERTLPYMVAGLIAGAIINYFIQRHDCRSNNEKFDPYEFLTYAVMGTLLGYVSGALATS